MTVSGCYLVTGLLVILAVLSSRNPPTQELINSFNEVYSTTNILIAFGVIGICRRLDKIVKKTEAHP